MKDSLANAEREFNKLSPPVRAYVKSPQTLRSLAGCDMASRFFTDYQAQFFARFTAAQADETPDYAALNSPGNNQKAIESGEDKGVKSD